jgi:hypothetical protein
MPRFEIDFLTEYTDEALLAELRRIAALLAPGEPLTTTTYERLSPKVAHTTTRRRFGGWKEALERAGLAHLYHGQPVSQKMKTQPARGSSDADLLAELKRVHAFVGKEWLTSTDFNSHSVTSTDSIRRHFGSFRKALGAAGIPNAPVKARQFTKQQCFENIAEVWTHYGRPPAYREMFQPPSRIQGKTYVMRWGTWRRTLKAFVDWANADDQAQDPNSPHHQTDAVPAAAKQPNRTEADCREIRPGLRFKVFMRDRFRCIACGRSPATNVNTELHTDHILAVANGGKTTLENLQTLCQDCNLGKGRIVVSSLMQLATPTSPRPSPPPGAERG